MIIDPSILPFFIISAVVVIIIPGADMIFIVANSVSGGKRSGFVAALGIASGALIHFAAAAIGISAIILASEWAYDIVRMLGAGYLIWIGFQYLTTKTKSDTVQIFDQRPALKIFRQGVFTNLLNPKAILFNLSFVPQFVSAGHGSVWAQLLLLGSMLIVIGLIVNLFIVLMASQLASFMSSRQASFGNYFERAAGVTLISLGVYLAIARKPA